MTVISTILFIIELIKDSLLCCYYWIVEKIIRLRRGEPTTEDINKYLNSIEAALTYYENLPEEDFYWDISFIDHILTEKYDYFFSLKLYPENMEQFSSLNDRFGVLFKRILETHKDRISDIKTLPLK